jgi:hypothetical protein
MRASDHGSGATVSWLRWRSGACRTSVSTLKKRLPGQQLVVGERPQLVAAVEDAIEEGACVWCGGRKSDEAGETRCLMCEQGS